MEDRLSSYADLPALEAEQTKIIKLVDDTITHIQTKQKELGNIQLTLLDATSAKQSNEGIKEAKKLIDSLSGSVYTYKQLLLQLAEVEEKKSKATTEQRIELAKLRKETVEAQKGIVDSKRALLEEANAIRLRNKEKAQQAKEEEKARKELEKTSTAYGALQKELSIASQLYKDLAASKGLDNAQTIAAQKRAKDLNDQLKAIDTGMGNYQRNVGNYSSAVSGLQFSFRNIAGELPNLGISLRTFGMAVSNNITPLVDNIAALKKENIALVASGKPAISLGKQIASSFLSWNTAVSLLIVGGLQLIDYFTKASKAQKEMSETAKEAAESQKKIAENIGKEVADLKTLLTISADTKRTYQERGQAVDDLQKRFPTYFAALSREAILNGDVATATELATQAIVKKAKETARIEKFTNAVTNLAELELELEKMTAKNNGTFKYYTSDQRSDLEQKIEAKKREVAELNKGITLQNEIGASEAYWLDSNAKKQHDKNIAKQRSLALMTEEERKDATKKPKDKTDKEELKRLAALKKASEELAATIMQQMNNLALNEEQITAKSLDSLLTSFENQEIGIKEYAAKKEQIVAESEDRILNYQIAALKDYLAAEGLQKDEIAKIGEKITDLVLKENAKRNKGREEQAKTTATNLMGFQKAMYDNDAKLRKKAENELKKALDFEKNARMNLNQEIIRGAWAVSEIVIEAFKASYQQKQDELLKENENIDANTQIQVKAIEESTLAEEEKQRRIKEAEATAAAQKEQNEIRIAELKTRSAKLDKMIEIAKVGGQTIADIAALKGQLALASAEAARLTAQALANPLLAPAAVAMGASVGVIGATIGVTAGIGAAQIAAIAARPIPKYADGTGGHIGGLAILGDGKEKELVIEPNKKPYWSADSDTIYNLPKHTQVIPESKLGSAITQPSNKDVVMAVMEMSGLIDGGLNKLNKTIRNKETVRLEAKNRRWQDYYYENAKA